MGEIAAQAPPAQDAPGMSTGAKLVNVFLSPAATFAAIARRPGWDWLVPVALMVGVACLGAILVAPKVDVDGAVEFFTERMEDNPRLTEEQREDIAGNMRQQLESSTTGLGRFLSVPFVLVGLFAVPAIYHAIAAMFGKKTTYRTVLAAYAWVQMVQVLKGALGIAVGAARDRIDFLEVYTLLKSNLGALLDPRTTSLPLLTLATSIDLFDLWGIVLGIIAMKRATRFGTAGAAGLVIGVWALWVLIKVAGSFLQSLAMG